MVERRYAAGKLDQLPDLAADLVRRRVDLIVTIGPSETLAASKATATIPIVFVSPAPVEFGLVKSLARPGGNVTGVSADVTPESAGKLLQLLKEIVPRLSRVAILWHSDTPAAARIYEIATREAAQRLGVGLRLVGVRGDGDFEAAFATIAGERPDALLVAADPRVLFHRKRITDFGAKHGLPVISSIRSVVDDGGLMSYGPDVTDMLRGLAAYVDKILKGAKPADLPVEQPTRFELVINLKTAKALGLTLPQSLLLRADEIIQ